MAIRDVVQEMLHQSIFVTAVLAMPNMGKNEEIEALAGSRNIAMHWGDSSQIVDNLVQMAIDRKIYVTPTPASIAAQVQLVEPALVLPRRVPAGPDVQEIHIHVDTLHIHVPQGGTVGSGGEGGLAPQNSPRWTWPRTAARSPGVPNPTTSPRGTGNHHHNEWQVRISGAVPGPGNHRTTLPS